MHLHPFAVYSLISALISFFASVTAWRRSAPGSVTLSLMLLALGIWSGFYATRWIDISVQTRALWINLMFIGVATAPTLFLLFALNFTHHESWLTRRNLLLLSIQPVVSLLLQWTNPYHLSYLSLKTVEQNGFMVTEFVRGSWYVAHSVYSYTIIAVALALLAIGTLRSGPLYRDQYRLILLGSLLPWAGSLYTEITFMAPNSLDLAPLTFAISSVIFAFSIVPTRLMDLVPLARGRLIENLPDGVLVLDVQNRIVYINPAMQSFLNEAPSFYLGKNADEIFQDWMEKVKPMLDGVETRTELRIPNDPSRYLDLRVTPLYDRNELLNGRLLVFRDITERKQTEKRLRYVNDRLQSQLIEIGLLQSKLRAQAIRDPLTNLFNRRYLEETLDRELARAARENYPICVVMMDLDHFKKVNDTYGHEAGDYVLKALADTLIKQSRRGDFACRHGGEEFVIVMPNINMETAYERAEKLRLSLNSLYLPYGSHQLNVTISMGIACFPANGKTRQALLRAADRAMYAAKRAGRDAVHSYDQLEASRDATDD